MAISATLIIETTDDRRSADRRPVEGASTLRTASRQPHDVVVEDLSQTGAAIRADVTLAIGDMVTIGLPGCGQAAARIVRADPSGYGAEFLAPLSAAEVKLSFGVDPVYVLDRPLVPGAVLDEPAVERWPGAVRIAVILGATAALWSAIITTALALR